jgi:hypothetical protein
VAETEVLELGAQDDTTDDEDRGTKGSPLVNDLIEKDLVVSLSLGSRDEERALVRFAAELDDGEAHACALAVTRGARVATDDRKALRVFRVVVREGTTTEEETVVEPVRFGPCLRTSELLFGWAQRARIPESELVEIVRAIADRASFFPARSDPYFERWMNLLEEGM